MADATDRTSILIVDDSPEKIVALESILDELGQDIVKAASGREALRHLLARDFAVILLDVRMPVMDGFETAALIRQRPRSEHTPIIFVTAFPDETHVARGYSLKAVDYIFTPVVPDVLRTKVAVFADLHQMTAQVKRQAESLRQRAAQLHRLSTASLEINGAQSLDDMVKVVADSAREILGVPRAVATARVHDRRIHRATSPAALAAPLDGAENDLVMSIVRSTNFLAVPLTRRDGRNMGELQVSGKPHGAFTEEDEDILVQLAQMTSIAVENTLYGELREANRLKDEFLATVSHELRTPLSAMLSWAGLLRGGKLEPASVARGVEVIERSAKAQAHLIDDLLDMSRIMTGKMRLDMRPLEVQAVVRGALDSVAPAAEVKSITLAAALDGAPLRVLGDPDRLQQVMWNLLSNAIKFTPKGGRIDIRVRVANGDAEISVGDTGAGISPEFLPHVFDRFRQADSTSTRSHGRLGLGLAIVRHLVDLHGGTVHAESAGTGRGATFVVSLPLRELREEPAAATLAHARPRAPAPGVGLEPAFDLRGLRVLLVEDDADGSEAIATVLVVAGAEVRSAGSTAAALEVLATWRPDVLVSDIGLPGEDGYALLRRVRTLEEDGGARLPAIALTAYAQAEDRIRALTAGFQAHVAKPVEPRALLEVLAGLRAAHPPPAGTPAAPTDPAAPRRGSA